MKKIIIYVIFCFVCQKIHGQQNQPDKDFNFVQKMIVNIFPNKTAKAIKNAIKKHDFTTAKLLLDKAQKSNKAEVTEMTVCYNIVLALFYENYNLPDSSCKYYKNAKQSYFFATPKDLYVLKKYELDGKKIDEKWINKQVEREICKLFCDRAMNNLINNSCNQSNETEEFINSSVIKKEQNVAPKSFYIAQGMFYEFCKKDKRKACDFYKLSLSKTSTDKDKEILSKYKIDEKWLSHKNEVCRFYSDRIIEKLQNFTCQDSQEIFEYKKEAEKENEIILAPKSYYIAIALYYTVCKKSKDACDYFPRALLSPTEYDKEILSKYKKFDDKWLDTKISDCGKNTKQLDEIKEKQREVQATLVRYKILHIEVDKMIRDTIEYFKKQGGLPKTEFKVSRIGLNGESIEFLLTTEFDESQEKIYRSKQDNYGLGSYKSRQIDDLVLSFTKLIMEHINKNGSNNSSLEIEILGTADGNPIGNTNKYNGDIGNLSIITTECYSIDKNSAISEHFSNNKSIKKTMLIKKGHLITDYELGFLRALNFLQIIIQNKTNKINNLTNNIYVHDFEDNANNKKGEYRKVSVILTVKNIYANVYDDIVNQQKITDDKIKNLKFK